MRAVTLCQPLALLLTVVLNAGANAEEVFIRDTLYVPLRGGPSAEHRILHRGLASGTSLTVLEENPDSDYSLVRTANGLEGWLPTQYLSNEPVARDRLESALAQVGDTARARDEAEARVKQLETNTAEMQQRLDAAIASERQLQTELSDLTRLAANVIEIDEDNRALQTRVDALNQEVEALHSANAGLTDSTRQDWFLRGAGVVLAGLLVGFWLARRIYHRRHTGGWS